RRTSQSRGMLFYRLIEQAVITAPLPYRQIVERKHNI
ncbi:MAG: IS1595 family transposase, partial [Kiritimatiellia bacterium]|nr:IS1595 family transposase [Kiritimatiellia bacterium]